MNGRIIKFEGSVHAKADRLLPWWVNGTLAEAERLQVELHLAECASCRREAAWLRALQEEYPDHQPAADDTPHPMRRLRRRIASEERAMSPPSHAVWYRRGRRLVWLAAAQAALVLGLGVALWHEQHPAYHTLGVQADKGSLLVVVFDPRISEAQLRQLVRAGDARIVGGPTAAGAYLLRVPDARANAVRRMLHDSNGVTMVENLEAGGNP